MSRARALLFAVVGLALPVGLALGVYVASAGSLEAVPSVVQPPAQIARSAPKPTTTSRGATTGAESEDLPGKCRDPEHQLDPDCDPRSAAEDDSSGHGSGGDDDDSSGHGSGGQGSSGSDDSGGSDDSSGHGSGDDD